MTLYLSAASHQPLHRHIVNALLHPLIISKEAETSIQFSLNYSKSKPQSSLRSESRLSGFRDKSHELMNFTESSRGCPGMKIPTIRFRERQFEVGPDTKSMALRYGERGRFWL